MGLQFMNFLPYTLSHTWTSIQMLIKFSARITVQIWECFLPFKIHDENDIYLGVFLSKRHHQKANNTVKSFQNAISSTLSQTFSKLQTKMASAI